MQQRNKLSFCIYVLYARHGIALINPWLKYLLVLVLISPWIERSFGINLN